MAEKNPPNHIKLQPVPYEPPGAPKRCFSEQKPSSICGQAGLGSRCWENPLAFSSPLCSSAVGQSELVGDVLGALAEPHVLAPFSSCSDLNE